MLNYFRKLGRRIATEWSTAGFDNQLLPTIACNALSDTRPCDNLEWHDILRVVATSDDMPPQVNVDADFGEPAITLFNHPRFYIEALYWVDGTIGIHQHSFSGAFAVLEGSSLQSRYRFEDRHRINADMLIGDLILDDVKILRTGDVEPILSGRGLIHSVFHLARPSVTVVVRTRTDVESYPQYAYHPPHVALNHQKADPIGKRRLQILDLLVRLQAPAYEAIAGDVVKHGGHEVTFQVLRHAYSERVRPEIVDRLIEVTRQCYGDYVNEFLEVIKEGERRAFLKNCRRLISDPEHRIFVALLMNMPTKESIFAIVQQLFPSDLAKDKVAQWAFAVARPPLSVDFDPLDRTLLLYLLDGLSNEEAFSRLAVESHDLCTSREGVTDRCVKLRNSIFRPLLYESKAAANSITMRTRQYGMTGSLS